MSLAEKEGKIGIVATGSNESLEKARKAILNYQTRSAHVNTTLPTGEEIKSIGKDLLRKALHYHKS